MRLIQNNQWVFDLPNGMTLTVNQHEAAEWIDGLVKDGERLRAELASTTDILTESVLKETNKREAAEAERDRLRAELAEARNALIKIRAHTGRTDAATFDLLNGLLDSIQRIADAALKEKP